MYFPALSIGEKSASLGRFSFISSNPLSVLFFFYPVFLTRALDFVPVSWRATTSFFFKAYHPLHSEPFEAP